MIATRAYVDAMVAESHRQAVLWPIMYLRHASDARLLEMAKALDPNEEHLQDVYDALLLIGDRVKGLPE